MVTSSSDTSRSLALLLIKCCIIKTKRIMRIEWDQIQASTNCLIFLHSMKNKNSNILYMLSTSATTIDSVINIKFKYH